MLKKSLLTLVVALAMSAGNSSAAIITQWDFEGDVTTPSTGAGTAALVGGTTATFATGNPGRGWNTTTYAAQGTESGARGVQFNIDTTGYQDITVAYDHRASGTASRWSQLQYTLNGGGSWSVLGNNGGTLSPHDTFYAQSFDLSSIAGANNNNQFGIRIVSIFSPVAFDQNASLADFAADSAYQRANAQSAGPGAGVGTGDYGAGGTWRFDNVTINGDLVPEPATLTLLAFGAVALIRRRR